MEGIRRASAVSRGVGQRTDDLELLDRRARPAVGDDERHGIFMSRPDVKEVDIQPVDLGDELGMRVQVHLAPPPVVIGRPMPRERLNEGELHALGRIGDRFSFGPSGGVDAPAQFGQFRFTASTIVALSEEVYSGEVAITGSMTAPAIRGKMPPPDDSRPA